jgi:hypothetical protein
MILLLRHFIGWMVGVFGSREDLILENLALRQQLLALHSKRPRHRLSTMHKLFWIALREDSGPNGKRHLSSLPRERWWLGIGRASGCTGDGSHEPDEWAAESA